MLGYVAPVRTLVNMRAAPTTPVSGSTGAPRMFGIPDRSDPQTRNRPSGLQSGARSRARSAVTSCTTAPPASSMTTSWFAPRVQRVTAIQRPSGDTLGNAHCTSGSDATSVVRCPLVRSTLTSPVVPPPPSTATAQAPSGPTDGSLKRAPFVTLRTAPSRLVTYRSLYAR